MGVITISAGINRDRLPVISDVTGLSGIHLLSESVSPFMSHLIDLDIVQYTVDLGVLFNDKGIWECCVGGQMEASLSIGMRFSPLEFGFCYGWWLRLTWVGG